MKVAVLIGSAVAFLGLAALESRLWDVPLWIAASVALAALLINGLVATIEDDLPGGFNNPDGTTTPRYIGSLVFLGRLLLVAFVVSCLAVLALWRFG